MPKGIYKRTNNNTPTAFKNGNQNTKGKHWKWTEESKDKIRGDKSVFKRIEVRKKLSKAKKGKMPNFKGPWIGHKHTDEWKKERSDNSRGNKSPNWKGGITSFRQQIRHTFKYRQWRSDVFTRDDFTCQKCGARSGNGKAVYLEAHHYPKSFSEILDEYKIKTLEEAINCEELWNINNGQTLCKKCHNDTKKGNLNLFA